MVVSVMMEMGRQRRTGGEGERARQARGYSLRHKISILRSRRAMAGHHAGSRIPGAEGRPTFGQSCALGHQDGSTPCLVEGGMKGLKMILADEGPVIPNTGVIRRAREPRVGCIGDEFAPGATLQQEVATALRPRGDGTRGVVLAPLNDGDASWSSRMSLHNCCGCQQRLGQDRVMRHMGQQSPGQKTPRACT
ncbi:hypothetical protein B0H19DRAFT_1056924 [Mycena capillaripes]|nr:hypothetical protein B0H19DRAFT_1056924 [Mycena capillaripes]